MIDAAREVGYLEDFASVPRREGRGGAAAQAASSISCTGSQGEAPLGPGARRARPTSAGPPRARRHGDLLLQDHPGQRAHALQSAQPARGTWRGGDHRGGPFRPRLGPSLPWRSSSRCTAGSSPRSPCRSMARRVIWRRTSVSPRDLGVPRAILVKNGDVLRLAPGAAAVVGEVPVGRRVLESDELVDATDDLYRERRRLMKNHGTIFVTLVLDELGTILVPPPPDRAGRSRGRPARSCAGRLFQAAITGAVEIDGRRGGSERRAGSRRRSAAPSARRSISGVIAAPSSRCRSSG